MITVDRDSILQKVLETQVSPGAKEQGMLLVEEYLERLDKFPDTYTSTLGVEVPFYIRLDTNTYIVGVVDRVLDDEYYTLCEWKSRRPPKIKKDGNPYKGDTEDDWLETLGKGPQVRIYALAETQGLFLIDGKWRVLGHDPRVLIRAVLKSNPPDIWPSVPEKGIFKFETHQLKDCKEALIVKAEQIRAARKVMNVPWQITGDQCISWGRECQHFKECNKGIHPDTSVSYEGDDPGLVVARVLDLDPNDPDIVVLSQSGYQTATLCMEKYRRGYLTEHSGGDDSENLDIGTVLHAGLAETYRTLKVL